MSPTDRLQAMFARACLDLSAPFEVDLAGFLAAHGVTAEDAAAIVAAPRRLGLYRRLVRQNVTGVVESLLETTRRFLAPHAPGALADAVAAFLAEVGPRTVHLRDVPRELLAFAGPRWRRDPRIPAFVVDLAELEGAELDVAFAAAGTPPDGLVDVALELPLVLAEPRRRLRFPTAVSLLDRADPAAVPEARPVELLVYRDAEHAARVLELTPLAAAILDALAAGEPLGAALATACARTGDPLDDAVLAGAARLLADLGARGVLLGAVAI